MTTESTPRVLLVCTGNICRSPQAELLLRSRLTGSGVDVSSAGTYAMVGESMPREMAALASARGLDPRDHRARDLTVEAIDAAVLVLTLAREHRRRVVTMHPRANRYTFTLREFARLARGVTDAEIAVAVPSGRPSSSFDSLRELVSLIASRRGTVQRPIDPNDDDVVDPYREPASVYARSDVDINEAVTEIAEIILRTLSMSESPGVAV